MNTGTMAISLFGDYYRERRIRFSYLTKDLIRARMYITVEKLLSTAALYSLFISLIGVTLLQVVLAFLVKDMLIWRHLLERGTADINLLWVIADFSLIVIVAIDCFLIAFLLFTHYPRIKAWERKKRIDGNLPYAICWMSLMASTGVIPYMIFK